MWGEEQNPLPMFHFANTTREHVGGEIGGLLSQIHEAVILKLTMCQLVYITSIKGKGDVNFNK